MEEGNACPKEFKKKNGGTVAQVIDVGFKRGKRRIVDGEYVGKDGDTISFPPVLFIFPNWVVTIFLNSKVARTCHLRLHQFRMIYLTLL
jgi:hypothetical protein